MENKKIDYTFELFYNQSDLKSWRVRYTNKTIEVLSSHERSVTNIYDKILCVLRNEDVELFEKCEIPIIVYSSLELVHKAFQLCIENKLKENNGFLHLFGHLMHAANPIDNDYSPSVLQLPMLYLIDFKEHPSLKEENLFYQYLDFAYNRHNNCIKELLNDSNNIESWLQNIIKCLSSVQTYIFLPKDELKKMDVLNYLEYNENDKVMAEAYANLYCAIISLSEDEFNDDISNLRKNITIKAKGKERIYANMALNVLHKNRLMIPTYIYNELKAII